MEKGMYIMELLKDMVIVGLFAMMVMMAVLQVVRIVKAFEYMKVRKQHCKDMARLRERRKIREHVMESQKSRAEIEKLFAIRKMIRNEEMLRNAKF
jgi:hypothetical protein